jgi:hypothetical protein
MKKACAYIGLLAAIPAPVLASGYGEDLEATITSLSIKAVTWGSVLLVGLVLSAIVLKKLKGKRRKQASWEMPLFLSIVGTILGISVFLVGSTIYLNTVSSSKGPVHWHADFEIWACGEPITAHLANGEDVDHLKDPQGRLSNKIGTATYHEHNDKRIHLEGVVVEPKDASLGKFFHVIGGSLTASSMVVPTNDGNRSFANGQRCGDTAGQVQVFAFKQNEDKTYSQQKLTDPASYVISPNPNVPPADCLIFEFDRPKAKTDKLCRSYRVANQIGDLKGER